jgi:hypothetical protein
MAGLDGGGGKIKSLREQRRHCLLQREQWQGRDRLSV